MTELDPSLVCGNTRFLNTTAYKIKTPVQAEKARKEARDMLRANSAKDAKYIRFWEDGTIGRCDINNIPISLPEVGNAWLEVL